MQARRQWQFQTGRGEIFQRKWVPNTLLLVVFLIFLFNAMGIFSVNPGSSNWFSVHAGTLFHSRVIVTPEFISLLITGLLLVLLLPWLSPVQGSILTFICAVPPVYMNIQSPGHAPLVPMEYSLLVILVIFSINVLLGYFDAYRQKQSVMNIFGQYIPPQLASAISRHPELVRLEGESRVMTVLFCDLQDFTGVAEQLNSKQLVMLLNDFFTVMTGILHDNNATIDKYIGDSIMCFWGAPLSQPDHARLSVLSALQMQEQMQNFTRRYIKRGWPELKMGIGINTGMMNVGNMGSRFRVSYTVLGDPVNLASRLEGLTRRYNVPIIVGENTVREVRGIAFRELDTVQVRGKHTRTRIYQPLCPVQELPENRKEQLGIHEQAVTAYNADNLDQAKELFGELLARHPEDGYYPVILKQISERQRKIRSYI